jgi:nucleoprotein TPR
VFALQKRVEELEAELKVTSERGALLRKQASENEERAQKYLQQYHEVKQEMARMEEQLRQELTSSQKLMHLYQQKAEESSQRVSDLQGALDTLRTQLEASKRSFNEELHRVRTRPPSPLKCAVRLIDWQERQTRAQLEQELDETHHDVEKLQKKLSDLASTVPSQLLMSEEQLRARVDEMVQIPDRERLQLLIGLEQKFEVAAHQLQVERSENRRLNNYLNQILQEIEEKAPLIEEQRREWDRAIRQHEQLSTNLEHALRDNEKLTIELNLLHKQKSSLSQECEDLAQQVQILLKESQRGTSSATDPMDEHEGTQDVAQLVEFSTIQQLHSRNRELLRLVRELSREQEDQEQQGATNMLNKAVQELKELREDRQRQEERVQTLSKNCEMYQMLYSQAEARVKLLMSERPHEARRVSEGESSGGDVEELHRRAEEYEVKRRELETNMKMYERDARELREECAKLRMQLAHSESQTAMLQERTRSLHQQLESEQRTIKVLEESKRHTLESINRVERNESERAAELARVTDELRRAVKERAELKSEAESLQRQITERTLSTTGARNSNS